MRVVLVLGPSIGGIGTYVRALAQYCVEQGDQVIVAAPAATEAHFSFTATGARVIPLRQLPRAFKHAASWSTHFCASGTSAVESNAKYSGTSGHVTSILVICISG